jgi:hypothetical protein
MSDTLPSFGDTPDLTDLTSYINDMPGGRTAGDWQCEPHRFVIVDLASAAEPLTAIARAYPPSHLAERCLAFVVPRLAAELLCWYAGEGAWWLVGCSDDVPAAVPHAALHAEASRWSAIYNDAVPASCDQERELVAACFDWNDADQLIELTIAEIVADLNPQAARLFRQLALDTTWPSENLPEFLAGIAATADTLTV